MTDKTKRFFTPQELSEHLDGRIKVRTLNNWRQDGSGPPFTKIGGAVLYPVAQVQAWLDARTVSTTSQYKK